MRSRLRRGFSLIELVIVVVIIAVVGAIAIPRLSRGSAGAADSALTADLAAFSRAIDWYAAEHGGSFPDVSDVGRQLTMYTDESGDIASAKDGTHLYGPYLRTVPPQPKGARKGMTGIAASDGPGIGWIYDAANGVITVNGGSISLGGSGTISQGGGSLMTEP